MIGSSADRDVARASSGCSSTCVASRGFGFAAVSTLRTTGTANLQSVADEPKRKRLASAHRLTMERRQAAVKFLAIGGDLRRSWPHGANTLAAEGETKGGWPRLWL